MKFLRFRQSRFGSSLTFSAVGWLRTSPHTKIFGVGARATLLFPMAHFASQNTNSVGVQSEGEAERGRGGPKQSKARYGVKIPPRLSRSEAPPPCSVRAEHQIGLRDFLEAKAIICSSRLLAGLRIRLEK